jgi:hypothetical protein
MQMMKLNKSVVLAFVLLVLSASLYRIWDRPAGFAPMLAMSIFGGAILKDKKLAMILPLLSMLLSDTLYHILYINHLSSTPGFYQSQGFFDSQFFNYSLFAGLTLFGFLMKKVNTLTVLGFSISGSILYFLTSNFFVWLGGGGFNRPKTFEGMLQCYNDALAFYRNYGLVNGFEGNFILGDIFFCAVLFATYELVNRFVLRGPQHQLA